jgi:hypothetical protein
VNGSLTPCTSQKKREKNYIQVRDRDKLLLYTKPHNTYIKYT